MNAMRRFTSSPVLGRRVKEFIQMRRDRLTFAMMIGIPLLQLILFGYAINSNPQHLPAAVLPGRRRPRGSHAPFRRSRTRATSTS